MSPLKQYKSKRKFNQTSEPKGATPKRSGKKLSFVVQKHNASHLHYDFRLEIDGVLKSWAVPKGVSRTLHVKRLAVHVEDHPMEYGKFEGVIPKGQYGAGTVEIWDKGRWESLGDSAPRAYKNGNITIQLSGEKLKGIWKLLQFKNDPKHWLLIRISSVHASPKTVKGGSKIK